MCVCVYIYIYIYKIVERRFSWFSAYVFKLMLKEKIFEKNLVFAICIKPTVNCYEQILLDRSKSLISLKLQHVKQIMIFILLDNIILKKNYWH